MQVTSSPRLTYKRCNNTNPLANNPLASFTMGFSDPNPKDWILRFKSNHTTVLLHVDPLQSFTSIKQEILKALAQTHPEGVLNGYPIPQNANDVLLARPHDVNDLNQGFESIEPKLSSLGSDSDAVVGAGKGKGKAPVVNSKAASGRGSKAQWKDCPQGAGLRDHGIVAFKFRREEDEALPSVEQDEDDDGIVVSKEDMRGLVEEWDVVVPSFEETYGEEP